MSNGDSACSSLTKSPSSDSSSSPIGFSSETGCCAIRRMSRTSAVVISSSLGDLVGPRLAAEALHELALDVHDLVQLSTMWTGMRIVRPFGDRARHRLPDPPPRVRRELVALAVVELLDCAHEAHGALLDQIEERQAAAAVRLRDRDDEPEVRLDHLRLGGHVAALDPLSQVDLPGGR